MKQEACKKDAERAFGTLLSHFGIVVGPINFWRKYALHDIVTTCIILHNIIIEDELNLIGPVQVAREVSPLEVEKVMNKNTQLQEFIARHKQIRNKDAHITLRNALNDHL
ncbi:hypothetical protein MA16_Dca027611 [Dendrobium catenatum]|uniref:DDE Tnp4 domain-containing protein n=1 Tax=Dendrobium catenatum TaxID=906689 RepID=A0A2I0VL98_9ASPA|nr:hypothetical protein MA16_Dca027611 [Dendrobium catenatum]